MSTQPKPPARKSRRALILAAVVLVFACGLLAVLFMPEDDPAATAPEPTSEPEPAATEPTATEPPAPPAPTEAPTAEPTPADPTEALRASVAAALGDSNRDVEKLALLDVRPEEDSISVAWAADDHFTQGMIGSLIQSDTAAVLQAITAGDVPFQRVFLSATFPNAGGQEVEVFNAFYTADALGDAALTPANAFDLAERHYLHPDLQ